jgi:hypothetical protein
MLKDEEEAVATAHSPKLLREVLEFPISYLLSETAIYERSVNYPFTISLWKKGRNTFATYHHDGESVFIWSLNALIRFRIGICLVQCAHLTVQVLTCHRIYC